MNSMEFIKEKQHCWAQRRGLELVPGTIGSNGEKDYVNEIDQNLFEPLSEENITYYNQGDGSETQDDKGTRAKMKALFSSSALVVNVFQYWQKRDVRPLLHALNLPLQGLPTGDEGDVSSKTICASTETSRPLCFDKIKFEEKFPIFPNRIGPNMDAVIYGDYDIAIESKFLEPYYNHGKSENKGMKEAYLKEASLWDGLPNLYELAKEMSVHNNMFRYLDAAQLIKHILGLNKKYNKSVDPSARNSSEQTLKDATKKHEFYLVYLWYNVPEEDGTVHKEEIEQFAKIVAKDNIHFKHITYQEVINNLKRESYEGNEAYLDYLTDRYL